MTDQTAFPALVTGASRGLGYGLALALAGRGHHVVAVARTTGALEDLDDAIQKAGGTATLAPLDVTDDAAMQHLCRSIHDRWGGVSVWAHTAIQPSALTPAQMVAAKDWTRALAINVEATRRLIAYVSPLLGATGHALFFDDPERPGAKFFGTYGATKAAQMALAKSWAAETVTIGPHVHILTPPPMHTAVRARFFPGEDRTALHDPRAVATAMLDAAGL